MSLVRLQVRGVIAMCVNREERPNSFDAGIVKSPDPNDRGGIPGHTQRIILRKFRQQSGQWEVIKTIDPQNDPKKYRLLRLDFGQGQPNPGIIFPPRPKGTATIIKESEEFWELDHFESLFDVEKKMQTPPTRVAIHPSALGIVMRVTGFESAALYATDVSKQAHEVFREDQDGRLLSTLENPCAEGAIADIPFSGSATLTLLTSLNDPNPDVLPLLSEEGVEYEISMLNVCQGGDCFLPISKYYNNLFKQADFNRPFARFSRSIGGITSLQSKLIERSKLMKLIKMQMGVPAGAEFIKTCENDRGDFDHTDRPGVGCDTCNFGLSAGLPNPD